MKILTMLSKYQFIKSALLVLPLGLLSSFTFAQNNSASNPALSYPTKPIKFIVAFAPGGPADIIARLLGQKLGEAFAQAVVIENKAGAGGNIASLTVAKAPPDGYTVLVNTSSLAVNESLLKNPGFDAERDLVVASIVASSPNLLVSYPGLKAKTLQEVVAMGPEGHLNFGTAGAGTTPHLTAEYLLNVLAKVKATHIPFQGATPALQAAMAGQTELASVALPAGVELVKSGRVRGLAVTSAKRNTSLPDVPTLSESGYPGFVDYTWVGLFFPAKTPVEIIKKMNEQTAAVLKNPDFLSKLDAVGFEGVGGSPAQAHEYLRAELVKWAKVVKETGVRIE
jgi:tripartite-type tricarboxylate transporter receptor subunit TctC